MAFEEAFGKRVLESVLIWDGADGRLRVGDLVLLPSEDSEYRLVTLYPEPPAGDYHADDMAFDAPYAASTTLVLVLETRLIDYMARDEHGRESPHGIVFYRVLMPNGVVGWVFPDAVSRV